MDGVDAGRPAGELELELLGIEAAAIDRAQAAPPEVEGARAPAAPAAIDHAADARELIDFAIEALRPLYPSLGPIYTPEVCARLAAATGRLLAKYDINIVALAAQWEPEVRFALVAIPLIAPTVLALRADRAAATRAAAAPAAAPASSPASSSSSSAPVPAAEAMPIEPPPAENPLARFGQ